jgi:nucleoside-diphosphate-sugar epimerase
MAAFRRVNVKGTVNLAQKASRAGVRRFIYLSSVKVNGEGDEKAYNEESAPQPEDPYGISKMEGEIEVRAVCNASDMEKVVIRPPLVYGAGVKANFKALMNMVNKRIPLPLATVRNRRSFIYLGNLVDSIITCMTHPAAAGQTYLVSDDRDVSTPELIRLIAASLNTPSYLFPFPPSVLWLVGKLVGKGDTMKRLIGSLSVDISKIQNELSWQPPFSMESGLMNTSKWYTRG